MRSLFLFLLLMGWNSLVAQESISVYFASDRSTPDSVAESLIDSFVRVTTARHKAYAYKIDGFCDSRGTRSYNNTLSLKRAMTVRKLLLAAGVISEAVDPLTGHGESMPLNQNRNEAERAANRRVTVEAREIVKTRSPGEMVNESILKKLSDTTIRQGSTINLQDIHFIGGRRQFLPESYPVLEDLWKALVAYPGLVIEIEGHICCIPGDEDGMNIETGEADLSEQRARAVYEYLVGKGVDPQRLSFKGYGHSKPIYPYPEKSEKERIANRRVEIRIVQK